MATIRNARMLKYLLCAVLRALDTFTKNFNALSISSSDWHEMDGNECVIFASLSCYSVLHAASSFSMFSNDLTLSFPCSFSTLDYSCCSFYCTMFLFVIFSCCYYFYCCYFSYCCTFASATRSANVYPQNANWPLYKLRSVITPALGGLTERGTSVEEANMHSGSYGLLFER